MAVREAEPVGSLSEVREAGLDREDLLGIYRNLLVTRGIEERGHILYKQGKIPGSFYTGRGNEASAVGVATAMGQNDVGTPLHRDMGVHITRGVEPWRIFAQYMGREEGPTRGRDGNVHMADARLGMIAMVSHLPAMLPVAVGAALAFRIREEKRVAVGWFGEGAAARGDAHEAMNLAGVRQLPVVFICDNNQWAYSTPTHLGYAVEHLADRAAAYGFDGVVVDGTDVLAVYREARRAIEKAREGGGPTLIESQTLRMEGHAVHDDAFYVPKELFEEWAKRDPIERYRTWLRENAELTDDEEDEITGARQEAPERRARARGGVAAAGSGDVAGGRLRDARGPRHAPPQVGARGRDDVPAGDLGRSPHRDAPRRPRLHPRRGRRRLRRRLQGHPRLPGGVRALARDRRAARRDRDRRCLHGRRDDGHAARLRDAVRRFRLVRVGPPRHGRGQAALPRRHARADRRPAPVRRRLLGRARSTRRTPRARSRTSPASSASARRRPRTRRGCSINAIEDPNPVLFFEHKHLYRRIKGEVPEERYVTPFGKARTHREGDDVSVITWGAMVYTADEAAKQLESDGVSVEIIDLRTVMPWDQEAVLASAEKTSKVLVLHEDTRSVGFGAEIAATIAEEAFEHLDAPIRRITAPDTPVPFSPVLEKAYIPQVEDVVAGLRELAAY